MNAQEWVSVLKKQIKFDSNFIPSFSTTIMILSELLEERDRVYLAYMESGAEPVVTFTTDRGATNLKPNPLLKEWQELNITALQYLRDLGLTPAGLRKLQGQLPKDYNQNGIVTEKLNELRAKYNITPIDKCETQEDEVMQTIRRGLAQETKTTSKRKKSNGT